MSTTKVRTGIDCQHFINGQYVDSANGKTADNINPATEEVI